MQHFSSSILGLGVGFSCVLLPACVNEHFEKKISIASGIALSGGSLGILILPPIVEILLNNYGLSKTFLFLGGLILCCIPPALLLRRPNLQIQKASEKGKSETQSIFSEKKFKLYTEETNSANPPVNQNEKQMFPFKNRTEQFEKKIYLNESVFKENVQDKSFQNHVFKHKPSKSNKRPDIPCEMKGTKTTSSKQMDNRGMNLSHSYQSYFVSFKNLPKYCKKSHSLPEYEKNIKWSDPNSVTLRKIAFYEKESHEINYSSSLELFNIVLDPMFVLIAITKSIVLFTYVCLVTIIIDFARDLQVGDSNEKYALMSLAIGDLVGRFFLGFVTDHAHMSTPAFCTFCFAFQGLFIAATVWSRGLITLLIFAALYGLSEGGIIMIIPVIISQYIDPHKQTIAISSSAFLSAPLCLAVSPLIGKIEVIL